MDPRGRCSGPEGPAAPGVGARVAAPLLPWALMLATACGGDGTPPASAVAGEPARVLLTIGEMEGPDEVVFGRVSGLARDGAGRIYVADLQSEDVRVFDLDGSFLGVVGATEAEPGGTLSEPCCLAIGPDGLLWVRESGFGWYSAFQVEDGSGALVRFVPMAHDDRTLWTPPTFTGDGLLVDVGLATDPLTGLEGLQRFFLDPDGRPVATEPVPAPGLEELGARVVALPGGSGGATVHVRPAWGPVHLTAHGPGGQWSEAVSSTYDVVWHLPGGQEVGLEGPETPGPALSDRERARAEDQLAADRRRAGGDAALADLAVPDAKPPLQDLFFDQAGRLWVQLSVPEGTEQVADLWRSDGRPLGRRSWPANVVLASPGWIDGDEALGVEVDAMGIQRVVLLRWAGSGAP